MLLRAIGIGGGVLLLGCGLAMLVLGDRTRSTVKSNFDFASNDPRHLVTEAMTEQADRWTRRQAPHLSATDGNGRPVELAKPGAERPQFVYFIVDGCPCSVSAEPLFQRLWAHFRQKIQFVAVTDGDGTKARAWTAEMAMPYPLISDPKLRVVRAFGATNSVFSALIDRRGRIVRMWPGYSRDIMAEMNVEMAKLLGEPPQPFDAQFAPVKRATGCAFSL